MNTSALRHRIMRDFANALRLEWAHLGTLAAAARRRAHFLIARLRALVAIGRAQQEGA
jgi:hypothetical protein